MERGWMWGSIRAPCWLATEDEQLNKEITPLAAGCGAIVSICFSTLSDAWVAVDCTANCLFTVVTATHASGSQVLNLAPAIDVSDLILRIRHRRLAGMDPV